MLKIRGVISFTFQMAVKRCVVRIRSDLKAEVRLVKYERTSLNEIVVVFFFNTNSSSFYLQALGTAIASTKVMKAQQVVKGEDGNEVSKRDTRNHLLTLK